MNTTTIDHPPAVPAIPKGLKGVVAGRTSVGDVQGEHGFYHYRQYSATDLARTRTFEDTWALLVDGELPVTQQQRDAFLAETVALRAVPQVVLDALPGIVASSGTRVPLAALRSALSLYSSAVDLAPLLDRSPDRARSDSLCVSAVTPVLAAALYRLAHGVAPVPPRNDVGCASNYLWMLTAAEPDPDAVRALEAYLVSTIDHGFNASTFTARVVASTGADVGSCIVAALGSLSGPLHGGAPSRALALLDTIAASVDDGPYGTDQIDAVVQPMIERGERIMGFGHAVYRTEDPRSALLSEMADGFAGRSADGARRLELAHAVETRVVELLELHRPGRALRTNVEFYAAIVLELCGIPPEMFSSSFASSRVVGWCAHVLEQDGERQIIRPSALYVGPAAPRPVPHLAGAS